MTKTTIEQADEIIGIDWRKLGISPCHDTKNIYRRGAYIEWIPKQKGFHGLDAPIANAGLEELAAYIVRLHAASKPKDEWLPDDWQVKVVGTGACCVRVSPSNDALGFEQSTADAVAKYIARCLTPAVRRLLAAFDVVESNRMVGRQSTTLLVDLYGNGVCRLVPKEAKP